MIEDNNSEKSVFEEIPTEKIYSEKAIRIGTFFAGPLVAGYCIAENFKAFNDAEKAKNTWIITTLSMIAIIGLIFIIPDNFPNILFPVLYSAVASYFLKKFQEQNIQKHIQNGGETFGGWRVTLIGLLSILIFFGIIMSVVLLTESSI
ncbi:hypothetical protein [Flavobacterium sharifuzzamanii]|uniref:hypothetical protein n=1 Tax=Flavobacterium sharifuzzamanii TaxID=2211133 RepID=UPI000DAD1DE2|nr:hypothetical protein [Flavobacterium sharifuzzamanii]KAF2078843.1 hypothetical protein DMA14_20350 [Flavobacterium sharifuzzamanii]